MNKFDVKFGRRYDGLFFKGKRISRKKLNKILKNNYNKETQFEIRVVRSEQPRRVGDFEYFNKKKVNTKAYVTLKYGHLDS